MSKIKELTETDRIFVLNNRCQNEAELRLKVPNVDNVEAKEMKMILEMMKDK